MQNFDFIIVGLGTAGSAASMTLSHRSFKVLGIDAFRPPHNRASHKIHYLQIGNIKRPAQLAEVRI